ncbi:RNA-binding protein [Acrasis kona]|uniref:RNA-binding protein n=1 Tax=Acrasis kona TaxID=1008807 RepID=A0AAW2YVH2_9EUKA
MAEVKEENGNTLFVGGLDKRIREIHLLDLFKPYGTVTSFQFLFTKEGQPRGYAFIRYDNKASAIKAIEKLNGKIAMGKSLTVKIANQSGTKKKPEQENLETQKQAEIIAIKKKLKQLENQNVGKKRDRDSDQQNNASKKQKM